jgi:hypothetical protein
MEGKTMTKSTPRRKNADKTDKTPAESRLASFDRYTCRMLRAEIDAALKQVAEKHGISLRAGNARFGPDNMSMKLEAAIISSDGQVKSPERTDFERHAAMFGFKADDLGATFPFRGTTYEIVGLKVRSRKYPVLGKRADGKTFKFNANDVLRAMGREVKMPDWM